MTDRFRAAMRLMRQRDPQAQEDGFHALQAYAEEHVEELISEFLQEPDHGLRCWLLELIGEARSPLALRVLVDCLYDQDEALRGWAIRGLRLLDSREARVALWRARANGIPVHDHGR